MPSTLTSLLYHVVFSTKLRQPLIEPRWRDDLYAVIGGIVRAEGGVLLAAGGTADHVHLLLSLSPTCCLSDAMRAVKSRSSRWARLRRQAAGRFQWQGGYGAFTVSKSHLSPVRDYIQRQDQHHRRVSFQEELIRLLERQGIEYDARYLWE